MSDQTTEQEPVSEPMAPTPRRVGGSLGVKTMKIVSLIVVSVFLTIATFVLGAMPMRVLRSAYGRVPFWLGLLACSGLLAIFVLPSYGLLLLALTVAVGAYAEIEDHGEPVFWSGFGATLAALGASAVAVGCWIARTKIHLVDEIRAQVTPLVEKLTTLGGNSNFDVDSLIQQLPSGFVIGIIVALALGVLTENRWRRWYGLGAKPQVIIAGRTSALTGPLATFRVPDIFIWLTTASVFGAFYHHGIESVETVSINALNVLVVAFFFQGLAVAAQAFRTFKVAPFWRALWYMILVLQLFLLVALVGFADFWLDFRERLTRKPAEPKKIF